MSACIIPKVIDKLYPEITKVFVNPELLKAFFFPLFSFNHEGQIFHMIAVPGLFNDEEQCQQNAELSFFGFSRNQNGQYDFLGNLSIFEDYQEVPELYEKLSQDWLLNKDRYYQQKIKVEDYILALDLDEVIKMKLETYISDFYGYQMVKLNWERTERFETLMSMTKSWGNLDVLEFISDNEAVEEFFMNRQYNLKFNYDLTPEMMIGETDKYEFLSVINGGTNFIFWNSKKDIVYLLEYYS
ncbi:unnamed protein product [Commensalibacter communis]|uniref:hypothetical protein n=1 Tax=Commensalibacter communis TaxID=2972786 RepID=UPI0022FF5909|nr:hypothetical protein [Commensalibacter communis]CAI3931145.1 unnamed protein product [Commensalibacter communis]